MKSPMFGMPDGSIINVKAIMMVRQIVFDGHHYDVVMQSGEVIQVTQTSIGGELLSEHRDFLVTFMHNAWEVSFG